MTGGRAAKGMGHDAFGYVQDQLCAYSGKTECAGESCEEKSRSFAALRMTMGEWVTTGWARCIVPLRWEELRSRRLRAALC